MDGRQAHEANLGEQCHYLRLHPDRPARQRIHQLGKDENRGQE